MEAVRILPPETQPALPVIDGPTDDDYAAAERRFIAIRRFIVARNRMDSLIEEQQRERVKLAQEIAAARAAYESLP